MTNVDRDKSPLVLLVIALGIAVAFAALWWRYTIDDAFIFYRYAANFARGHGPVFNLGERVEGYSSVLWMSYLALARALGLDPVIVSKGTGLASALALLVLLFAALRRAGCPREIAALPAAWLAGLPGLHLYSVSGLETVAYAFAVAAAAILPGLPWPGRARTTLFAASLVATWGLRPEGVFPALAISLAVVFARAQRSLVRGVVAAWAAILALWIAKGVYYGAFVPNTYLAKPSPLASALGGGWAAVVPAIGNQCYHLGTHIAAWGGVPLLGLALVAALDRERAAVARPALAAFLGGVVFLLGAPPDWMPEHRFALPYAAPLLFAAGLGLAALWERVPRASWPPVRIACVGGTALWLVLGMSASARLRHDYAVGGVNPALDGRIYAAMGQWLRAHAAPGDRVLAYEVGAVGYVSGLGVVDHEALVTRATALALRGAGGYRHVRTGDDPDAMRRVVAACLAPAPDWFLVRALTPTARRLAIGSPVPPSAATERIQQAMLEQLGDTMVLARVFPLAPDGVPSHESYLLLRRMK